MAKQYGNFTDFLSITRASSGTALRKVKFGPNLVTTLNDATTWTVYGTNTVEQDGDAVKITYVDNGSGAFEYLDDGTGADLKAGTLYRFTFSAKVNSGAVTVQLWDNSAQIQTAPVSNTEYQTFVMNFLSDGSQHLVNMTGMGGSEIIHIKDMKVQECQLDHPDGELILFNHPDNVSRLEYDEFGRVKGVLIEESRTNLCTGTSDLPIAANRVEFSAISGPDGSQDAVSLLGTNETSGGVYVFFPTSISVTSGTAYTASFYVQRPKSNSSVDTRYVMITSQTNFPSDKVIFDLQTGTVTGSPDMPDYSITPLIDDWYRITATNTATSTGTGFNFLLWPGVTSGGVALDKGNLPEGSNVLNVYGAQLEAGAFPTSAIPTNGSSATRSADLMSIDVDQFGYNQQAGSVVVTASSAGSTNSSYPRLFELNSGSGTDRIPIWINTSNNIALAADAGGVSQVNTIVKTGYTPNTEVTIAYGFRQDDYAGSDDGNPVDTDTTGDFPSPLTELYIGQQHSAGQIINGHVKSIKYYPRRLTDDQLEAQSA